MPLIRRWQRMPPLYQWAALCMTLLIIIAALVFALIAQSTAVHAGREARTTANCVNNVLGDRNGLQAKDAAAHVAFARADKTYDTALVAVLLAPPGPVQKNAYQTFIAAAQAKQQADSRYVTTLQRDQKFREQHPLGHC